MTKKLNSVVTANSKTKTNNNTNMFAYTSVTDWLFWSQMKIKMNEQTNTMEKEVIANTLRGMQFIIKQLTTPDRNSADWTTNPLMYMLKLNWLIMREGVKYSRLMLISIKASKSVIVLRDLYLNKSRMLKVLLPDECSIDSVRLFLYFYRISWNYYKVKVKFLFEFTLEINCRALKAFSGDLLVIKSIGTSLTIIISKTIAITAGIP